MRTSCRGWWILSRNTYPSWTQPVTAWTCIPKWGLTQKLTLSTSRWSVVGAATNPYCCRRLWAMLMYSAVLILLMAVIWVGHFPLDSISSTTIKTVQQPLIANPVQVKNIPSYHPEDEWNWGKLHHTMDKSNLAEHCLRVWLSGKLTTSRSMAREGIPTATVAKVCRAA